MYSWVAVLRFIAIVCVLQDFAIKYWIQQGASPSKLNVGMGTYGRSFTLQNTRTTDVGAAITGPGQAGPYTREAGTLGYNEVWSKLSHWPKNSNCIHCLMQNPINS
jgi:GH18 family chitinase